MASYEQEPSGSRFVRKGTPDAGVECFWELPTGPEHGWQAKFFTSPPSPQQWRQVDSSVKTALEKHPALRQYTICMALDRPDARVGGHTSVLDQWNERVKKWESWAANRDMCVNFCYWGTHEITERLSRDEHRGRLFFWFHEELFTPVWFQQRLDEAIAAVGPRYTPELNVQLPLSAAFEGLSRSPDFLARLREAYGDVGKASSKGSLGALAEGVPTQVERFNCRLTQLIELAKGYDRPGVDPIDWAFMESLAIEVITCADEIGELIRVFEQNAHDKKLGDTEEKTRKYSRKDHFDYARYTLRRVEEKLEEFRALVKSDVARLANEPALLLVGSAGTGKTHLFSDAARVQVDAGSPGVLLLGSQFHNEEPWQQILRILDVSCTTEEFLGALEAAAQLAGRRAVIFIDALNEGAGRSMWETHLPAMLARLTRHPWIAVAVSVRSSYEKLVIPDGLVPDKLVRLVHHGFANQEYAAAKAYFDFYGIELPAVPILTPEFQNPLFLRCFCRGLQNRKLTKIPTGIRGISSVFAFFLDSVNEKLAKPDFLDYDPSSQLVPRATRCLAAWLSRAATYGIPREEATRICDSVLPGRSFERSLFRHLLSEGVLAETLWFDDSEQYREIVTFSYERLADHLVVKELLAEHVDPGNPAAAFVSGQPLSRYFEDETACWQNRGLAEALAIQGPEVVKKEIFELLPETMNTRPICEAFIEGLIWRDPRSISDRCLPYINGSLTSADLHRTLLDALLTIAPNPEHPFNADFLHSNLMQRGLAERDSWWSIFLYDEYGEKGSVDRLIDWARSETSKAHIADESIRLTGKVLTWFLTTSHRFLRDRTTKALVSLFVDRIHVLCELVREFIEANDPYVLERLFSVAYGCALRSNDSDAKLLLGQLVYDVVFKDSRPPCHILLRDYARGVVEVALRDGLPLKDVEPEQIRPPYDSEWPLAVPPIEELEKYGERNKGMPDEQWAQLSIYNSVLNDGDFARYILGSDYGSLRWSKRLLNGPRVPSRKEQHDAFVASLTDRQKKAWEFYLKVRCDVEWYRRSEKTRRSEIFGEELSEDELETVVGQAEHRLLKTLGKKKTSNFHDVIRPYLDASPGEKDEFALPVSIAQRWILKRVFELGWTVERFGRFDRYRAKYGDSGRSAHKPERIGKKYQWLAWHEFLAHMADNLEFRGDTWSEETSAYVGPWQMRHRDIDPSCLLDSTCRQWAPNATAWWTPVRFDAWAEEPDDIQWLKRTDLLPSVARLPVVTDIETGKEWFVLECSYEWEEPTPPDKDRFDVRRRHIWYSLNSYLVKAEDEERFYEWAKDQHFMGRSMPESHEQTGVYLGEFFWAPASEQDNDTRDNCDGWRRANGHRLPCDVLVTTEMYMQEASGYDCSISDTISIYLPAKWIARELGLSWRGVDGCYFNAARELVAHDPSVRSRGPSALLMNKEVMSAFLDGEGYRLVWTVLGSKDIRGDWVRDEISPGRMELSGCMRMNKGGVDGLATAFWVTGGSPRTAIAKIEIS